MSEIDVLEEARRKLGLSVGDLWFRYFALGGMSTALEVEAVLYGALVATSHDPLVDGHAASRNHARLAGACAANVESVSAPPPVPASPGRGGA